MLSKRIIDLVVREGKARGTLRRMAGGGGERGGGGKKGGETGVKGAHHLELTVGLLWSLRGKNRNELGQVQ